MRIGKSFIPTSDQSEFEVTVRAPAGSSIEGTDQVMRQVEADIKTLPGVRNLLTTIGSDFQKQVDRGSIIVELVQPEDRKHTQEQLMDMARDITHKYKEMVIGVQLPALVSGGTTANSPSQCKDPSCQAGTGLKRHHHQTARHEWRGRPRHFLRARQARTPRANQSRQSG